MINMFNEKIYIFLWWWCFVIAVVTCASLIMWLYYSFVESSRQDFVVTHLRLNSKLKSLKKRDVEDFTSEYLQKDGVFILRLISDGVSYGVAYDIMDELYTQYRTPPEVHTDHSKDNNESTTAA
jgi:innexin